MSADIRAYRPEEARQGAPHAFDPMSWTARAATDRWLDRLYAVRNRVFGSARFQRWAAGFPLTRPIARHHARALFDLTAGFVYSQVLLAAVRLNLLDILADGPLELEPLAGKLGLTPSAAACLLDATSALRLTEPRGGGRHGLGVRGAMLRANRGITEMVEHHGLLYDDLRDPVALLRGERTGTLGGYWPYAAGGRPSDLTEDAIGAYTELMSASQALVAADILDAWPLDRHACLLDVGGGDGTFAAAAAARAPDLRVLTFDLPAVAARANERFVRDGLGARARAIGGDFFSDPLPAGADVISMVRVIHDHDDERALQLLRAARAALPADGTLLLAEPMAGTRGAETVGAYFGFYLLAMGSGRPRTQAELEDLLRQAGFTLVRAPATRRPLLARLVVARPKAAIAA